MATTKTTGGSRLGKDARPKYLGVKITDGQKANAGNIIIRQRGSKFIPGKNVKMGSDDTLYAVKAGKVSITAKNKITYAGKKKLVRIVSIK
jgi:large subunit ribosomal protein L27